MATVVCAGFSTRDAAERGAQALVDAGVARERVAVFYLTPPRAESTAAPQSPQAESPGSADAGGGSGSGAGIGALVGGVVGAAATPIIGPLGVAGGAGIGAYTGSLLGALGGMTHDQAGKAPQDDRSGGDSARIDEGMRVAAQVEAGDESRMIGVLASAGGVHVATVDSQVIDGVLAD